MNPERLQEITFETVTINRKGEIIKGEVTLIGVMSLMLILLFWMAWT